MPRAIFAAKIALTYKAEILIVQSRISNVIPNNSPI